MATITIDPGGGNETTVAAGKIDTATATKTHTGVSDWSAEVAFNTALKDRKGDTVWIEDSATGFFFRGFLLTPETTVSADDAYTVISGLGVEHDLERNAGEKTVQNALIADAIDDYFTDETGFSATVTAQPAEDTTTDESIQEANTDAEFNAILTDDQIGDSTPLAVQNTNVETLRTGHTQDDDGNVTAEETFNASDDAMNDGDYTTFINGTAGEGVLEFQITPEIDIASANVDIRVRDEVTASVEVDYYWNDVQFDDNSASSKPLGWSQISAGEYGGSGWGYEERIDQDLNAGQTYTLKIVAADAQVQDDYKVDAVAVHDDRFSYTYSNPNAATNGGGILDGPEEYPGQVDLAFDRAASTWNVTSSTLTTTWDDTSGNQRLQARLPPTGAYAPSDGTEDNTASVTTSFGASEHGTAVQARVRFSRYGTGGASIPATGFNGQKLQSLEITIDGDDRPVYTDTTLEGSDLDILQKMHRDSRARFWVTHAKNSKNVTSEPAGDTVEAKPDWTVLSTTRRDDIEGAYNHVTVRGQRDANGNRLKKTLPDAASIAANGQEHWDELAPDAETQVEVERIARQVLKRKLQEFEVAAEREIASIDLEAGPAYPVELPDGTEADIPSEEITYMVAPGDVTGTVRFGLPVNRLEVQQSSTEGDLRTTQLSF